MLRYAIAILLCCSSLAYAAQPSVLMLEFNEAPFTEIDGKANSIEQIKHDIVFGAGSKGWVLVKDEPNAMTLRLQKRDWSLDVLVSYRAKSFKVSYLNSNNLGYGTMVDGSRLIHPNYNRWIPAMIKAISPATIGTGATSSVAVSGSTMALHYHRPRGDYSGWGLHLSGDVFGSSPTWFQPLKWSGMDEFGAIYVVNVHDEKNIPEDAQASYILHNGDAKDQCGQDMPWDYKKSKEIYVVSEDCSIYYSLEDAKKSKHYR